MSGVLSFRVTVLALGVALLLTLAAGGLVGARLARWASQPVTQALEVPDPASAPATTPGGLTSRAGFTGFGGPPALQGVVLQSGTAALSPDGRVAINLEGGGADVAFTDTGRLFRIVPATTGIAAGDRVVIRLDGTAAAAVLRSAVEMPESAAR
ncbi:MAG: hypothetical protein IT299_11700 [Dehalococcoidia bacterium]|nr:hypothetical protein [Dehalococcoidia bacterium]